MFINMDGSYAKFAIRFSFILIQKISLQTSLNWIFWKKVLLYNQSINLILALYIPRNIKVI